MSGHKSDELAALIRGNYVGRLSFSAIVALVTSAFFVGLFVFGLLTRRLSRFTDAVQSYSDCEFAHQASNAIRVLHSSDSHGRNRDEIGRLTSAVNAMVNKIQEQSERLKEMDRLRRELISVADTGVGIPRENLDSIFDRFYSTGASRALGSEDDNNSTGLGLAIVKRILDLHDCRITVSSIVNEGTCFEFDLPTAEAA